MVFFVNAHKENLLFVVLPCIINRKIVGNSITTYQIIACSKIYFKEIVSIVINISQSNFYCVDFLLLSSKFYAKLDFL